MLKNHKVLPAVICIQRNANKEVIEEKAILKSNLGGMGNDVGSITNRITAMMEAQSHFDKDSEEYKTLQYRIEAGQHYQQLSIDKIKGIVAAPMPESWYKFAACKGDEFARSICCEKRPYFMTYVYPEYRVVYLEYNQKTRKKCKKKFKISYENLQKKKKKTKKMLDFIQNTERFEPFGMGECTMNKICYHIENEFKRYHSSLKKSSSFDYTKLMKNGSRRPDKYFDISDLVDEHQRMLEAIAEDDDKAAKKRFLLKTYREDAFKICPDENELADIMVALTYGQNKNQELCWGYVGKILCNRLREMKNGIN